MKEKRIVSFLPSATELIYELGAKDRLHGVTPVSYTHLRAHET